MKRLLLAIAACAALISAPGPALAAASPVNVYLPADTGISSALLSSGPTMSLRVGGFSQMTIYIVLTRAAATAVTISCTAGPSSTVQAPVAVAGVNSTTGAIAMVDGVFTWSGVASTRNFRAMLAPLNDYLLVCTFTGAGATSDTISVHARAAGQL
jgi:hypothetical protein